MKTAVNQVSLRRHARPGLSALVFLSLLSSAAHPQSAGDSTSGQPTRTIFQPYLQQSNDSTTPQSINQSANQSTNQSATQPATNRGNQQRQPDTSADRNAANSALADRLARPDPPTEFQRLVQESTGTLLPIYGTSIFRNVPSTFAPVDDIPVAPDYVIGPGDELRVQIFGQQNELDTVTVDRSGEVAFPGIGSFHVAGIPYAQLQSFLKGQLARFYRNFDLSVNLGQLRSIQVFVVGAARRPGSYTVSSLSTLLNALFASGGPLPQGSLRDIQLQRAGHPALHFDLYNLLLHGDKSNDVPLQPGDVVFIPPVGAQVALSGSIDNAAIYEILPGTTAAQALALAGGQTAVALRSQLRIERITPHAARTVADIDLTQANPVLENGDILQVGAILGSYNNAVTLRGNVAMPGRYVWKPGMRITDLVPSQQQLITRDFYQRRNTLGTAPQPYSQPADLAANPTTDPTTDPTDPNAQRPQNNQSGISSTQPTRSVAVAQSQQAADTARSGSPAQAPTSTSASGGSSVGSALTGSNGLFPQKTDVVLSAPDLDWSYAVIERMDDHTLTTSLLPFNPGKLFLNADSSQNLELKPGDVVSFFSTADLHVPSSQQTRFVRLEGEFLASGVYSVEPGETLRHLLVRAGGLTPDAYLYGSEFTRQSTRRVQQQRLAEFADSLEAQVSAHAASNSAKAINAADAAAADASQVQATQQIARLRRTQPNGRIVLELKPDSRGAEAVPELQLEDGDRFIVPRVPATVAVQGQVYSANAFVFTRGRRERDYLKLAGGPDREADRKRTFVLRADGSVFSSQYGNVSKANIFPGDTIVIPPRLDRTAILRNLVDLATVVGGLGVGIAAISVLK